MRGRGRAGVLAHMSDVSSNSGRGDAGHTPICALGASAGGLAPLRTFFEKVEPDLGLAFIVVVHLAPDHPSALAELLAAVTTMPVETVRTGAVLEPNHVYVMPPDHELVIEADHVRATSFTEPRGRRNPIDRLFESLASQRGDGVVVVLSGEGSDGAAGSRAVKEAGGLVLAQDPIEAEHNAMPRAAIDTGDADVTGPVADLAVRVGEFARNRSVVAGLHADRDEDTLRAIIGTLRRRVGHDFAHYKTATLLRRIGRRMQVTHRPSLADYAEHLRGSEEEAQALFADLLISVTAFFRDPKAFEALQREAIGPIFDRLEKQDTPEIRAWSVGCATGEEAYTIAMLLIEEADRRKSTVPIQIFATDIDEPALTKAREGIYGRAIEADVSDARLKRFFIQEGETWRVRQELRDAVLFARHSVLKDPPFMHLDLVACRNLLIYLDREMQRQVCGVLRYALDPGGFLMLGTAETADAAPEMFRVLDRDARLYVAEAVPGRTMPLPSESAPGLFSVVPKRRATGSDRGAGMLHLDALEQAGPPSALVAQDQRVLHLSPNAGRYLMPSGGPMPLDLPALARPELRLDLKVALHRALEEGQPTLTLPIRVAFNGSRRRTVLNVTPDLSADPAAPRALVLFLDGGPVPDEVDPADTPPQPDETRRLHEELRAAQERLAASRGEHEVAMQELRAANEELQSVNEEYRSTSEELETSKEELQSMNEELQTLNAELKSKLEGVSLAHNDLRNLVAATDFGTLFLDTDLKIRMFTPAVTQVFSLAATDIGRPITDFAHTLEGGGINGDARTVLRDLAPVERDARTTDGRWLTIRLRPYRTLEERIEGVVVTFIDTSTTRKAAERQRESEERFVALVRATRDAVYRMGPDWGEMRMLDGSGFLEDTPEPITDWLERYIPEDGRPALLAAVHDAIARKGLFELEHQVIRANGAVGWIHSRAAPLLAPGGAIREWFGVASDVTERRMAEERLRETRDMLALATAASKLGWVTWDPSTREAQWDARGREIMGLGPEDTQPEDWLAHLHPEDRAMVEAYVSERIADGRPFDMEFRVIHPDGAVRHVHGSGAFVVEAQGGPIRGTGLIRDVTARWQADETQQLLLEELNHRVKNMLTVILSIAAQTREDAPSLEAFSEAFEERVQALAQAYDALTSNGWKGANIEDLVKSAVALFSGAERDRVSLTGPTVALGPSAATSLSLALHELCTNALKYGALSNGTGRVEIAWKVEDTPSGRRFVFDWRERGTSAVETPVRRGFGSALLENGLPGELGGSAHLSFDPDGLSYRLVSPLSGQLRDG
ncbi:protein-glutamate O-methyltransferase [Acuticoccus sediminis]|uniref:Blue-light-activated histidine kinase n=2 Tax=Acuticoccus sediminis TaxID=2184697 RepID=A0A8B2NW06_9HYPH|nr:protein-glutamate O-methyltransferase [Acuticoccus sediminis]